MNRVFSAVPTPRYHINLFWSNENKAFIADVPDLRFCSAHGETPEEAVREVLIAQKAWLKSAKKHGKRIPKPRYRPAIYQLAS